MDASAAPSETTQKWQIPSTVYPRETSKTTGLPDGPRSAMIVIVLAPRGDFLMEERMRKLFILFGFALFATSIAQAQETRGMEVSGHISMSESILAKVLLVPIAK